MNDARGQSARDVAGPILEFDGEQGAGGEFLAKLLEHYGNTGGGNVGDPAQPPNLIKPAFARLAHQFPIRGITNSDAALAAFGRFSIVGRFPLGRAKLFRLGHAIALLIQVPLQNWGAVLMYSFAESFSIQEVVIGEW